MPSPTDVNDFLAALEHPLKPELEALRRTILAASPAIAEGIKWNAPSFRTSDWFATFNLPKRGLRLILHTGARTKGLDVKGAVKDPKVLCEWRGKDRAVLTFADAAEVKARLPAVKALVRQWVAALREEPA